MGVTDGLGLGGEDGAGAGIELWLGWQKGMGHGQLIRLVWTSALQTSLNMQLPGHIPPLCSFFLSPIDQVYKHTQMTFNLDTLCFTYWVQLRREPKL